MFCEEAILSEPKHTFVACPQNTTNNDTRPRRPAREHLKSFVLEELWSIWRANPRVPSVKSRRSWAISRNANPRLVDNWFLRRRTCAKKSGQPISGGSYDLSLCPTIAPKREQSATSVEPEAVPDLPSDDTLVYSVDGDDLNDLEASSDTVFDEDTSTESNRTETPARQVVPWYQSSFVDLYATKGRHDKDIPFEKPSFLVCNQGRGKQSNFTCILCSTKSAQGTPDKVSSGPRAMSDSDSRGYSTIPCLRLDFFPDTLSELSAIPFLFRTPHTVSPDNTLGHRTVDNRTVVEDELARLVNDGKLDFSFLDVPHLASMKLRD